MEQSDPERVYRWPPFGAASEKVGSFVGYRAPVRLNAGNHFETDATFRSFEPKLTRSVMCGTPAVCAG
jgi:hypothetical protein